MSEDKPGDKLSVGKPKIRPRDVDKPAKRAEEGADKEAGPEKVGPLPKRSDPEWLAKLAPAEPATPRRRRSEGWEDAREGGSGLQNEAEQRPSSDREFENPSKALETSGAEKQAAKEPAQKPESLSEGMPASEIETGDSTAGPDIDKEEEALWESQGTAVEVRKKRVKRKKKDAAPAVFKRRVFEALGWVLRVLPFIAAGFLLAAMGHSCGRETGLREGRAALSREVEAVEAKKIRVLPPEASRSLDEALREVREGDAAKAAAAIEKLIAEFPDVPSLHYLAALACAQAGFFQEAERHALASIQRGEKISDSKVLLSVLESQKGSSGEREIMGDPKVRAKKLLEEAAAADPANSGPRMELGTLLRYLGDREGAVREIRAAKVRMHPVDSQLAADVTVALIEVEELPPGTIEPHEPQNNDARELFPAAYLAMRAGNFEMGIRLLERCKAILPPDVFFYLINDPAFRKFSYREDIKRLSGDLP